ncbi:MAG: hypothetical protein U0359_18585 [Byssovorax sp.]
MVAPSYRAASLEIAVFASDPLLVRDCAQSLQVSLARHGFSITAPPAAVRLRAEVTFFSSGGLDLSMPEEYVDMTATVEPGEVEQVVMASASVGGWLPPQTDMRSRTSRRRGYGCWIAAERLATEIVKRLGAATEPGSAVPAPTG